MSKLPEFWLRGFVEGYPIPLQPVAHAILQAQEEIHELLKAFPSELLWEKPAGVASVAFHLQHIAGVLDRMATYSRGNSLTEEQFEYLKNEGVINNEITKELLLNHLDAQIGRFLKQLAGTDIQTLTDYRSVGRAQLPSTVGGLLFHAAEHMQRHLGQLLVTVRILHQKN